MTSVVVIVCVTYPSTMLRDVADGAACTTHPDTILNTHKVSIAGDPNPVATRSFD